MTRPEIEESPGFVGEDTSGGARHHPEGSAPASNADPGKIRDAEPSPKPQLDRVELGRQLDEARRLYELAVVVHERALFGSIDSAPLAKKGVTMLLGVLVALQGVTPPGDFEALVLKAVAIAEAEGLITAELRDDLAFVQSMDERFHELRGEVARADGRRYDRALIRLRELFDSVQGEFDAVFPPSESAFGRHWKKAALLAVGLVVGLVIGTRLRAPVAAPMSAAPVAIPAVATTTLSPGAPAFAATFYRDADFREQAFVRADPSVAFDWGSEAPPGLTVADHFSVRWTGRLAVAETGDYEFFLTSDDGSRLFIDEKLVVDNWGNHSTVTRTARIALKQAVYAIRVEYFEDIGEAMVRLEWQSDKFPRRIVGGADLR